jgi:hypothetical protein
VLPRPPLAFFSGTFSHDPSPPPEQRLRSDISPPQSDERWNHRSNTLHASEEPTPAAPRRERVRCIEEHEFIKGRSALAALLFAGGGEDMAVGFGEKKDRT